MDVIELNLIYVPVDKMDSILVECEEQFGDINRLDDWFRKNYDATPHERYSSIMFIPKDKYVEFCLKCM